MSVQEDGTAAGALHYQKGDYNYQPIEIQQNNSTPEEFKGHLRLTAIDYLLRMDHKGTPLKDAKKALQYCKWLVDHLEGRKINPRE